MPSNICRSHWYHDIARMHASTKYQEVTNTVLESYCWLRGMRVQVVFIHATIAGSIKTQWRCRMLSIAISMSDHWCRFAWGFIHVLVELGVKGGMCDAIQFNATNLNLYVSIQFIWNRHSIRSDVIIIISWIQRLRLKSKSHRPIFT